MDKSKGFVFYKMKKKDFLRRDQDRSKICFTFTRAIIGVLD